MDTTTLLIIIVVILSIWWRLVRPRPLVLSNFASRSVQCPQANYPPIAGATEELKSRIREGNLGQRRKAFLQEILRRRDEVKTAGRSRLYAWLAAAIGVVGIGIVALTRRK